MRGFWTSGAVVGAALLVGACDEGGSATESDVPDAAVPDAAVELSPLTIACDHFEYGPAVTVTAADAVAEAPSIEPHTRSNVTLVATADGNGGQLDFDPGEGGHVYFALGADVGMQLQAADGSGVELMSVSMADCAEAKVAYLAELGGGTYRLVLGPTPVATVALVVHIAPHDDGHEQAHEHSHGEVQVPAEFAELTNPLAGDVAATTAGEALFGPQCGSCHGEAGRGDGPAARGQTPAPTDLADADLRGQSDGYLFWRMTDGRSAAEQPSTMPAYGGLLTETQRWQVVSYLRTLSADAP